jgi:hypothetical protein
MTIDKIIAVNGKPGLYHVISAGQKNLIVESLHDGKRLPIRSINNVSSMDTIAIYTYTEEIPLTEVFYGIFEKESGKETISHKESAQKLKDYFLEVLPEYDEERVYVSNIKKIFQWYNILHKANFDFTTIKPEIEAVDEPSGE